VEENNKAGERDFSCCEVPNKCPLVVLANVGFKRRLGFLKWRRHNNEKWSKNTS
jgi:hypothetical protein